MSFSTTKRLMAGVIGSALLAAVSYVPLANAFGVGVQPSTVEMTIKPGDRQRQVVTVGNVHKTKTISLTMGLADWTLDKDGKLVLDAPGDTDRSSRRMGAFLARFRHTQTRNQPRYYS
ncbi:hypothetical protein AB8615_04995 [Litorimonas sp. RW-G-Af-16]|uniref:hypothetical protein n=1 Tax=Litorimonas sp. RW-G-Af-16 TaxID=3241168 RepID=UPI003AAD11A8